MKSGNDLDASSNIVESFIEEGDTWPAAVTTAATTVITHDDEYLINIRRSDNVLLYTTTNTMLPSPTEVDALYSVIDKENGDADGTTATVITQDDDGI